MADAQYQVNDSSTTVRIVRNHCVEGREFDLPVALTVVGGLIVMVAITLLVFVYAFLASL